jgi:hypothetical protein
LAIAHGRIEGSPEQVREFLNFAGVVAIDHDPLIVLQLPRKLIFCRKIVNRKAAKNRVLGQFAIADWDFGVTSGVSWDCKRGLVLALLCGVKKKRTRLKP